MCITYDNLDWIACSHADFANTATKEKEPAANAVGDVIFHPNPKVLMPEGFLIGKQSKAGPNVWQWFR